ncbi:hypothetical protein UlMin_031287 [Ulmus minor]
MANIASLVDQKPVVIFSKSSCNCMTHSIKTLINGYGANPTIYELEEIPNGQQIERELVQLLVQLGCQPSVPAVYIGQQLVGGADKIFSLQVQNQLVPLLMQAGAIWFWDRR